MFSDIPGEKYFSAMEPLTVLNKTGIEKTAEEKKDIDKKIVDFVKTIKSNKDKEIYCHIIALGAGEWFGANNNHDHFPAEDLFADHTDYGFKTFLRAGVYQGHRNKNYDKRLGNVLLSIVNPVMKRVELIVRADRDRVKEFGSEDLWERLLEGGFEGCSMGSRVPYDLCTCHNKKAKTRTDYCENMRNIPGKILPDGRKVFVYNPKPNFFDISFVGNPADKSARVIGHLTEDDNQRCIGKICVIDFGIGDKKMNKTAEITQIQNFETLPLQQITPQLEQTSQPEQIVEQPKVELKKKKEVRVVRHIKYRSLPISVENISGDYRIYFSRGGKYKKKMFAHYGFIPKTEGNDGEDVDVYLKPGANKNADVYVIHQMKNKDGIRSFDEDKIMLGFDSLYEARSTYLQHMPEKYFGGIKKMSFDEFLSEYLAPLKKEAEEIIKKAFCNCEDVCCTKQAENKNADIVKRIPAMMQKLPDELFSKIKLKKSLQ